MNVSEVMTRNTSACEPADSLERAAAIMWDRDCGAVPVVDGAGALHGIVTDRDVAMSAYLKGRPLAAITVGEVMSRSLHCCAPTDTVERALATMRQHQVHRMPVVDGDGRLTGMLAVADLLQATKRADTKQRQPLADAIVETLTIVRKPRVEAPLPAPATTPGTRAASVMSDAPAKAATPAPVATPVATATTAAKAPTVTPATTASTPSKTAAPAGTHPSTTAPATPTAGTPASSPSSKPAGPQQQPPKKK
jgi:CBS domain-containing protein